MRRLLLLLICWCTFTYVHADSALCQRHHCLAVVDAGSTGSRLHIYAYDLDEKSNPIHIQEHWVKKVKPGFAKITPTQSVVDIYLNNLFADAPDKNIPVYFYATAGMRLLPESQQESLYKTLRFWFSQHEQWKLMEAKTLTGGEEGVLGWLAVNYHLETLSSNKPIVNVIDIGGASVQIAIPIDDIQHADSNDVFEIDAYGRHFTLFAHSFLGLGQTVFSEQFNNSENCFSQGYPMPNGLLAKGDAFSCQKEITKQINKIYHLDEMIQPILAKTSVHPWYTIGGMAWLLEEKPISISTQQFTSQGLLEKANIEACQRSWQELSAENPNSESLYKTCFLSSFYYALIVNGYGLQPSEPINYAAKEENLDWALGVVLHH